jgi:hypothetical protein
VPEAVFPEAGHQAGCLCDRDRSLAQRLESREKALQARTEAARFAAKPLFHHGKSEKETTSEDVEAQTPEAPQGEPPQEAHLAKVRSGLLASGLFTKTRRFRRVFCFSGLKSRKVKH